MDVKFTVAEGHTNGLNLKVWEVKTDLLIFEATEKSRKALERLVIESAKEVFGPIEGYVYGSIRTEKRRCGTVIPYEWRAITINLQVDAVTEDNKIFHFTVCNIHNDIDYGEPSRYLQWEIVTEA